MIYPDVTDGPNSAIDFPNKERKGRTMNDYTKALEDCYEAYYLKAPYTTDGFRAGWQAFADAAKARQEPVDTHDPKEDYHCHMVTVTNIDELRKQADKP